MRTYRKYLVALGAAASLLTLGAAGAQASIASTASTASTAMRPSATAACGFNCFSLSSILTGRHNIQNAYVPHGNGLAITAPVGTLVNLKQGSDNYTQTDFTQDFTGLIVNDFCVTDPPANSQEFPITGYICLHYGLDPVFEANWSPNGNQSGNCVGVAVANVPNQVVTLQPCGETNRTMWIADLANAHIGATPWINGSDTNFTHPLVLTVNDGTRNPINQLFVERLNLLTGGFVDNNQEFRIRFGPFV
jgi:hypothetical protein